MTDMCKFKLIMLAAVFLCCRSTLALDKKVTTESSGVLATLDKSHPRLMLKNKDLERLKQLYAKDKVLQKCIKDVLERADDYCQKRVLVYKKKGKRLLKVCRECLKRVYALGLAWRWTGEEKYARKATEELLAVCAFKDWNPLHFLDTAEMSHAVGVGYDWLYDYFDDETREKIKTGLIKYGMKPGMQAYSSTGAAPGNKDLISGWWKRSAFNWNIVCNSGLLIGALAIAETDPEYAEYIVPRAVTSMPKALGSYAPDGAWMEGPGYWHYATRYTAYGLTALVSALGKDFGLSQFDGLSETGLFPIYMTGPTGLILNFADSKEKKRREPMPCMFWLAREYHDSSISEAEHAELAKYFNCPGYAVREEYKASPEHVVWYVAPTSTRRKRKELDRYFRGDVEIAVFRSRWDDPEALFVGVKGGYNQVDHGHLDLGSFELDALGVRWARDLGKEDYDLPGYWQRKKGGKRWSYYRLRSVSHNVPLLGGKDQDELAKAKFVKFNSEKSSAFVIIDLTSAYEEFAKKVTRGVAMVGNRRAVLVQDEFRIKKPCEVIWGMTTDAEIAIKEKRVAELTLDDEALIAQVLWPAGAEFVVESAEQEPPEKPNIGVKRLMVRLQEAKGRVRIAILLSPVWKDGSVVKKVKLKPLARW